MADLQELMMVPRLAAIGLPGVRALLAFESDVVMAQPDFTRALGLSASGGWRMALALCSKGLLQRQRAAHRVYLELTPEGRRVIEFARTRLAAPRSCAA